VPRPRRGSPPVEVPGLDVIEASTLRDAIGLALDERPRARSDALPAMLG
jgi:hypothetical protein